MRSYEGHSNRDPKGMIFVAIGAVILGYLVLNSLAAALGVDISAALSLVIGLVLTVALLGIGLWAQSSETLPITVVGVLPLAFSTLVMTFSPLLNQLGCMGPLPDSMCLGTEWWGSLFLHYGLSFGILIVGYGYLYFTRHRY